MRSRCCFCGRRVFMGERGTCCKASEAFFTFLDVLEQQESRYFRDAVHAVVREATK